MRDKLRPFVAAIFCAVLSVICLVAKFVSMILIKPIGPGSTIASDDIVFYCFMPMCFYFVGERLVSVEKENKVLRARLDEITAPK